MKQSILNTENVTVEIKFASTLDEATLADLKKSVCRNYLKWTPEIQQPALDAEGNQQIDSNGDVVMETVANPVTESEAVQQALEDWLWETIGVELANATREKMAELEEQETQIRNTLRPS